jgi:hypothetical protein
MTITDLDHPGQHYDPVNGNWVDDASEETPTEESPEATKTPIEDPAPVAELLTETPEPSAAQTSEPSAPVDEHPGQHFDAVSGNWLDDETFSESEPELKPQAEPESEAGEPEAPSETTANPGQSWLEIAKAHFAAAVDAIDKHLGQ